MSVARSVVIVGGESAGTAKAASLLKRRPDLDIAVIEPSDQHAYQLGWTMVGGGVFAADVTRRTMASVMPKAVKWLKAAAKSFEPEKNQVTLTGGSTVTYEALVVAPGIRLAWEKIEGLEASLGKNGVTSNYRYDLAPYTWELVQGLKQGRAIFTQPAMPIKCAGAPQKEETSPCDSTLYRIGEALSYTGDGTTYSGLAIAAIGAPAGGVGAAPGLAITGIGGLIGAAGQAAQDIAFDRPTLEIGARFFANVAGGRVITAVVPRSVRNDLGDAIAETVGEEIASFNPSLSPDRCP